MESSSVEFFQAQGYVVLRSFLSEDNLAVLERRCRLFAPDPALKRQYAQEDDIKRFEYSLSQAPPVDVLAKRRASELDAGVDGDAQADETTGPFQLRTLTSAVEALCSCLVPAEAFCIVSEPGSRAQVQHTDSIPMEGESDESWQASLHYVGLLVPLQDTDERCGQTAVMPGSHLDPLAAQNGAEVRLSMRVGDVLVLDGRTTHRGLANVSDKEAQDSQPGGETKAALAGSCAPPPRRICFFTFTLPDTTDGNALAYAENTGSISDGEENMVKKKKVI